MYRPILIVGKIGSGKTTVAEMLGKYGYDKTSFASPLKNFAVSIGFTKTQIYGTQKQKQEINSFYGISGREFMQKFGTDICRNVLSDKIPNMKLNNMALWPRVMEGKLRKYKNIVIPDGRFVDEAQLVREYGGIVVRISREHNEFSANQEFDKHDSEMEMDIIKHDIMIVNDGTLDELEVKVDGIMDYIKSINFSEPLL